MCCLDMSKLLPEYVPSLKPGVTTGPRRNSPPSKKPLSDTAPTKKARGRPCGTPGRTSITSPTRTPPSRSVPSHNIKETMVQREKLSLPPRPPRINSPLTFTVPSSTRRPPPDSRHKACSPRRPGSPFRHRSPISPRATCALRKRSTRPKCRRRSCASRQMPINPRFWDGKSRTASRTSSTRT